MKQKKSANQNSKSTVLLALLFVLPLIFIGVFLTQSLQKRNNPPSTQSKVDTVIDVVESQKLITQTSSGKAQTQSSEEATLRKSGGQTDGMGCGVSENGTCVITLKDPIITLIAQETSPVFQINNETTVVKAIYLYTDQSVYKDAVITDASGKTIMSLKSVYDKQTSTVNLYVGIIPNYLDTLSPSQRKSLYLEQTVRAISKMLGSNPDNFIKVHAVTQQLSAWQPA